MHKGNVTKGFEITYSIKILAEGLTNFKRRNSKSYGLIKISLCIDKFFSYGTVAHCKYISDYSRPILIFTNHATSGEIIGELSRFPRSEIFYPTLVAA